MIDLLVALFERWKLQRNIRRLRAIFVRNGKLESAAQVDRLEAQLRREGKL